MPGLTAALCATTLLGLSACVPAREPPTDGAGVSSPAPATVSALPRASGRATMVPSGPQELPREPSTAYPDVDGPERSRTPRGEPSWDGASRRSATETARQALTLFARPRVRQEQWWDELSPRLSPEARQAYQGVDPRNVTATKVTGTPVLEESTSPYLAEVSLEADDGTWTVLLSRDGAGRPWQVERFMPPGTGGG